MTWDRKVFPRYHRALIMGATVSSVASKPSKQCWRLGSPQSSDSSLLLTQRRLDDCVEILPHTLMPPRSPFLYEKDNRLSQAHWWPTTCCFTVHTARHGRVSSVWLACAVLKENQNHAANEQSQYFCLTQSQVSSPAKSNTNSNREDLQVWLVQLCCGN